MHSSSTAPKSVAIEKDTSSKKSACIWLDVGHAYEPRRWASGRSIAPDWTVWVRGAAGADINAFVDKVVFQFHPDTQFPFPRRVFLEQPYEIHETGSAPAELHIDVHLKCTTKPEQFQLKYGPLIKNSAQNSAGSQCICYNVQNPSEQLRTALIKSMPHSSRNKCLECEHSRVDIKNLMRLAPTPNLTESELEHVSHMYLAHIKYENSGNKLPLPPPLDPIYNMPVLPPSLRRARALADVEIDYALQ